MHLVSSQEIYAAPPDVVQQVGWADLRRPNNQPYGRELNLSELMFYIFAKRRADSENERLIKYLTDEDFRRDSYETYSAYAA